MPQNRRHFLKQALTGALWIGAGNTLEAFAGGDLAFPAKDKIKLRVAIASDGHFGQPGTNYSGMHTEMVSWINAEKKQRGLDFTFINGDLFHDDNSFMEPVKKAWDKLSTPYYVSHGNTTRSVKMIGRKLLTRDGTTGLKRKISPLLF